MINTQNKCHRHKNVVRTIEDTTLSTYREHGFTWGDMSLFKLQKGKQ